MQTTLDRIQRWTQQNDETMYLNLSNLGLTEVPSIPTNCHWLGVSLNNLTVLPPLPMCWSLYCRLNQITHIPELPLCSYLACHGNKYLTVSPKVAKRFGMILTPNYHVFAEKIQITYRKFTRKKYMTELVSFDILCKDVLLLCYSLIYIYLFFYRTSINKIDFNLVS